MLLQNRSGFSILPSRYSRDKRCFQPDFLEMERRMPGLLHRATGSCKKKLQFSQSVSFGELERDETFPSKEGCPRETPSSLVPDEVRNPTKESDGEFLHPKNPQRAMNPLRAIHSQFEIPSYKVPDELILGRYGTNQAEKYTGSHFGSTVKRRHSLSLLPSYKPEWYSPTQSVTESVWSSLGLDLLTSLPVSPQRKDDQGSILRKASYDSGRQSKPPKERNLELELSMMQFELMSLKQKMQSSFAYLEKEQMWLEKSHEDRKQNGNLDDKVFHGKDQILSGEQIKTNLAMNKLYLGSTESMKSNQHAKEETKDVHLKLITLQESSMALQQGIKALEKGRDVMAARLKCAEEEQKKASYQIAEANQKARTSLRANQALQKEEGKLQAAFNNITLEKNQLSAKVISLEQKVNEFNLKLTPALSDTERLLQERVVLHQQVHQLTQELPCTPKKQKDQTLAPNSELITVKTWVNHQEPEKTKSGQRPGTSLEKLHQLEAENKVLNNHIEALENDRSQLLAEMGGRLPKRPLNGRSQQGEVAALQKSCECLRESQSLLQSERDSLQTRCLALEETLQHKQEELVSELTQQQQISQYWRGRFEEVSANLKTKEEELEKAPLQNETSSAKVETPLLLQIQLDACKQELELEKNRSQVLLHQIQLLESQGQSTTLTIEASLEASDPELALVREELQKVRDVLKTRDTKLEEQQLELEAARSQYTECNSEKERLEQLVTTLEEEMAQKEQSLRDLKQARDVDRTELEVKISTLEQKVAEMQAAMEAARHPPSSKPNQALHILERNNSSVTSKDGRSWGACSHCSAVLLQLNHLIQSCAEKSSGKQEEEAILTYLYQVQDLLKGKAQDQNPVSVQGQRQTRKPDAKVSKTPQEDQESLRQQQQLVTEQLKGLFKQRKQLKEAGCKKQHRVHKIEGVVESSRSEDVLAMPEPIGHAKEGQPEASAAPGHGGEVQRLQQQLKEKTEIINSMAIEIQALQEKNESLMIAKCRFQQQIQEIRKLSKKWSEKSNGELQVPKPSTSLGQDLQCAQWSDSSAPSSQSDDRVFFSHSQEDMFRAMPGPHHNPTVEEKQSVLFSNSEIGLPLTRSARREATSTILLPPSQADPAVPAVPSIKPSAGTPLQNPQGKAHTEEAFISPSGSALLSPRPFGPQRPWSPFKFKDSPESLEN